MSEERKIQPLRELQWLADFFENHGREDKAHEIFLRIKELRQRAQQSTEGVDGAQILEFRRARKNGQNGKSD